MDTKKIPEVSGGQMKTILFLIVIVIIIYLAVTLAKRFGLFRTGSERNAAKEKAEIESKTKIKEATQKAEKSQIKTTLNTSKIFDPTTWSKDSKAKPSVAALLLGTNTARGYANQIYSNLGQGILEYDNEEAIYSVFRSLPNQINVSQLSFFYKANHKSDLAGDLINRLNKGELQTIYDIIKSKPAYYNQ
jgi:hypothetical protein